MAKFFSSWVNFLPGCNIGFLVAILFSTNAFSGRCELVPEKKILELISSDEVSDLIKNGVDIENEIFARAHQLCNDQGQSLYSLEQTQKNIHPKYICKAIDLEKPPSSVLEHIKAAGFALTVTCGVIVVLPACLCDFYCPSDYNNNARIAAAGGLCGMIAGIGTHLFAEVYEHYRRCCYSKLEIDEEFSDSLSDDDEGAIKEDLIKPPPILLQSLKCI